MTEKRFEIYDEESGYVRDNKTGNIYDACGGGDGFPFVINEYHKLQKENEQLKEDYDYLEKRFKEEEWHYEHIDEDRDVWMYKCHKLEKENKEFEEKLNSISDIIDEQIWQVNHTHENCKRVGIAELKKLKKVLICNSIIQDGDLDG